MVPAKSNGAGVVIAFFLVAVGLAIVAVIQHYWIGCIDLGFYKNCLKK